MNITLKRNYGFELIFEAENVKVTEDIEERIYSKTEDGKTDYKIPPKRDIQTHAIEQFVSVLDDMIYYREAEFDSSSLIERLFEKLPQEVANKLLVKLKRDYEKAGQEAIELLKELRGFAPYCTDHRQRVDDILLKVSVDMEVSQNEA